MRKIYVKEEVCMGCHLCEVYCQLHHSKYDDLNKAFKKEDTRPVSGIRMEERKPIFFSVRCQHCEDSPCVYACLTGALSRDRDSGMVTVDEEKCSGCWTCILACPFGAIKQDAQKGSIIKCDLCQGEDMPVCVSQCPNEALIYTEADTVKS